MKVRAVREGYYRLKRQKPGSIFFLKDEKDFSKKWMKKLEDSKEPKSEEVKKPASKAKTKKAKKDEEVI